MAPTIAQIVDQIREIDLLDAAKIAHVQQTIKTQSPSDFVRELVRQEFVTPYQANKIAAGKTNELLVGPYLLLDPVGKGGMGEVFKARHTHLDRIVALKLIQKSHLSNSVAVKRFYREAKAAARLNHPNVIAVHDVGESHDAHYLAMEYAEGIDLSKLVHQSGRLPIPQACEFIRQAALGLHHAHENGLVHRDIKPGNLLVTQAEPDKPPTIKVLDFGLARFADNNATRTKLTQIGKLVGTVDYISPEQAVDARKADVRSDIYSLGCSLFFLLTGNAPFAGESRVERLSARLLGTLEPVRNTRPEVPVDLEQIIGRMVAPKPDQRFQNANDVATALAPFAKVETTDAIIVVEPQPVRPRTAHPPKTPPNMSGGVHSDAPFRSRPLISVRVKRDYTRRFIATGVAFVSLVALAAVLLMNRGDGDSKPNQQAGKSDQKPEPPTVTPTNANPTDEKPKHITNSIGMKLVLIPAGKFTMGSPGTEKGRRPIEGPQHEVHITKPFYMGVYEVTQAQYERVMGDNPSWFSSGGKYKDKVAGVDTSNFPVEFVSWKDADEFCKKLSNLPAERTAGRVYRLPSEAQWEYTCRGGAASYQVFHFGNSLSSTQANFNGQFPYGTAPKGPYLGRTTTVGSYQPNAFGVYDMHGNVWEWCDDWYDAGYYAKSPLRDPKCLTIGSSRVIRGGGWLHIGEYGRAADRRWDPPAFRNRDLGFRAALVVSGEPIVNPQSKDDDPKPKVEKQKPKHITNSIGMKLVLIPAGKFTMGSPGTEKGRQPIEGPQHEVHIAKPFYMGVNEVTQAQYAQVMGTNPSYFSSAGKGKEKVRGMNTSNFSVEQVSWNDAVQFCRKLSNLPKERAAGRVYRLPTEAEWEYTCRGGADTYQVFHFGNTLSAGQANCKHDYPDCKKLANYLDRTTSVGSYLPNAFGVYDMHGNVWEWCQDWYGPYKGGEKVDPQGPSTSSLRAIRGGCWKDYGWLCRAAFRRKGMSADRGYGLGFRAALVVSDEPIVNPQSKDDDPKPKQAEPKPKPPVEPKPKVDDPKTKTADKKLEYITNSIGMKLVLIPAGKFTMGSPATEKGRQPIEGPQHEVHITKPFYMGVYEVTQAQYAEVMGTNPSYFSSSGGGKQKVAGMDTSNFPVESVIWNDAVEFCKKLSDLPKERAAGRVYRLPTEAEWEYTCRGGAETYQVFHFGNTLSSTQANFNGKISYGGAAKERFLDRTTTVGSYQPNAFGVYDMHGNVWEWCADWYDTEYYAKSPLRDPKCLTIGSSRVLRGGCWLSDGRFCRAACRYRGTPAGRDFSLGFRTALVPSGE